MEKYKLTSEYDESIKVIGGKKCDSIFFTIIIPTYCRADLIQYAISSAINQKSFDNYEIIVVDNEPYNGEKNATQISVEKYVDKFEQLKTKYKAKSYEEAFLR